MLTSPPVPRFIEEKQRLLRECCLNIIPEIMSRCQRVRTYKHKYHYPPSFVSPFTLVRLVERMNITYIIALDILYSVSMRLLILFLTFEYFDL